MMRPMSENDAYINFTFNRLVLDHEAERSGFNPPRHEEIVAFVKTLRPFQGNGGLRFKKYTEFAQNRLPALGFNEAQLEELVSDQLALNRVKDLLGAGLHVADSETRGILRTGLRETARRRGPLSRGGFPEGRKAR